MPDIIVRLVNNCSLLYTLRAVISRARIIAVKSIIPLASFARGTLIILIVDSVGI